MLDFVAALSYLVQGKTKSAKAVWSAWCDFLKWHKRLAKERKAIRADVKREAPIYHGSIVLRYLFCRKAENGKRKAEN